MSGSFSAPNLVKPHDFSRLSRLTEQSDYRRVFTSRTKRIATKRFLLRASKRPLDAQARLGLAVAKRILPKAVLRNRVRRLVRDSFRLEKASLGGWDYVVQLKHWSEMASVDTLKAELSELWTEFRTFHASSSGS